MFLIRRSMIAVAATAGLIAGGAVMATADSGDGSLACNVGEICFSRDPGNTTYQKHFWYSGNHDGYTFTNVNNGAGGQGPLRDNARQVRNRDTSCAVKVTNVRTLQPDQNQTIANNGVWTALNGDLA